MSKTLTLTYKQFVAAQRPASRARAGRDERQASRMKSTLLREGVWALI